MPRRAIAAVKRRDPLARTGLLVCLGFAAAIGTAGWLWWRATNAPRVHLTMFFTNTVHGVDIGSPVKIHGVQVGQIEMMGVRLPSKDDPEHYAIVKVALEGNLLAEKGLPAELDHPEPLRAEIARGLRGRMQLISPITGDLYLELEYKPETTPRLVADPREGYAEVPTLSDPLSEGIVAMTHKFSELEKRDFTRVEAELLERLDRLAASLAEDKFSGLNASALEKLRSLRDSLANPALRDSLARVNRDIARFRDATRDMNRGAADAGDRASRALADLRADLALAASEADKIAVAADPRSPAALLAIAEIAAAAENATRVRRLCAEIVEAQSFVATLLAPSATEADAGRR